jgi:hypothetical protein
MWLLIDDVRDLNVDIIARNAIVGKRCLVHFVGEIEHLCIDHDLGDGESGHDLIKWAVQTGALPPHVQIVSSNPVGRMNITKVLEDDGYTSKDHINYYKGE